MENSVSTIEIFNLMIKIKDNEAAATVDIAESFTKLFPGNDMMGTILVAHVKSFLEELMNFISTRSEIILDSNAEFEYKADDKIQEIVMPLSLDQDSSCVLNVSALKAAFESWSGQYEEKMQPAFDIFWKFIMCEIHDFESDLSHEINHFWGMKEKGVDIQVFENGIIDLQKDEN